MCTIGTVFSQGNLGIGYNSLFKQCDLQTETNFLEPVLNQEGDIRYVALTRERPDATQSVSAWAGVNEFGVGFVAADSYLKKTPASEEAVVKTYRERVRPDSVFDMYLQLISACKTLDQATQLASDFYAGMVSEKDFTDILLIGDSAESRFIETYAGNVAISATSAADGWFASTNHMRMIGGAVDYADNRSTYLRLGRAETVISANPTHSGIGDTIRDQHHGETVWSIDRYAENFNTDEAKFYTQASVIINVPDNPSDSDGHRDTTIEYVINGRPSTPDIGIAWRPFTSSFKTPVKYIGKGSI
jgi:hypothetical protein